MVRKLDLSIVHDRSVESGDREVVSDVCERSQDNEIDIIEQSPLKDTYNGCIEETSTLDEVTESPSTPEEVRSSGDEINLEKNSEINSSLQLEQRIIGKDEGVGCEKSNEGVVVRQTTPTITKKLGHRDLRDFAFVKKSERDRRPPQSSRSRSLPGSGIISRTPNRKIMSSEDFLCPLEHKKHKMVTSERAGEDPTTQVNSVQGTTLSAPDEPTIKNVPPIMKVINNVMQLTLYQCHWLI